MYQEALWQVKRAVNRESPNVTAPAFSYVVDVYAFCPLAKRYKACGEQVVPAPLLCKAAKEVRTQGVELWVLGNALVLTKEQARAILAKRPVLVRKGA